MKCYTGTTTSFITSSEGTEPSLRGEISPACSLAAWLCDAHNQNQPLSQQSSFTHPHPPGKLHLLIGLDGGKLLCHRSMCPTSACPRDSAQNNQKVLLTPLLTVTKTSFLPERKNFWKVFTKITNYLCLYYKSKPRELKTLTATHLPTSLCDNVTVAMSLRQNLPKHNSPPTKAQNTHIHMETLI